MQEYRDYNDYIGRFDYCPSKKAIFQFFKEFDAMLQKGFVASYTYERLKKEISANLQQNNIPTGRFKRFLKEFSRGYEWPVYYYGKKQTVNMVRWTEGDKYPHSIHT